MKVRALIALAVVVIAVCAGSQARDKNKAKKKASAVAPASASAAPTGAERYSGMYSFLKEGEFVQLTIEQGRLSGFVSRMGDLESDRGLFLDQFFDKGTINGNQISFLTKPVHGTWFVFDGRVDRGPAKTPKEEGYWMLNGKLKQFSSDAERKISSREREVNFKSFPQDDETGDEEAPPKD